MRIAVTGSHGLVAGHLLPALEARGHQVVRVVRGDAGAGPGPAAHWDPAGGRLDPAGLAGVDGVVHLAGVGIGDRRWSAAHKQAVLDSRVAGTTLLATTLAGMARPPRVLVSASAVGYYGDRDDELLGESSPSGAGFLAEVCRRWEAAAAPATGAGIRTVVVRSGVVLAADGGLLRRQLPLFRLGLGARLGRGRQWVSWISVDDEVAGIVHALERDDLHGPLNLVAPSPVTNATLTSTLGGVLGRPAPLAVPAPVLRIALGAEMADELALASQRVQPGVLAGTGFAWEHPTLDAALRAVLGR